jgi:uncharacterized glyoxalase superfamily protein PhnB
MTGAPATTDWGSELTHILVVRDIATAVAFYRDVLGATVLREYGGRPACCNSSARGSCW